MKKVRLDRLLVERGLCPDCDAALRAVLAREVKVGDAYVSSAALMVPADVPLSVKGKKRYVSRGGFKLRGALDAFSQDVSGMRCVDVGSSTGGFTDCLLQAGAAQVTCVDVNYGQLAWELRTDDRVVVFERTNIRTADPIGLGAPFDLIVADVSFISLAGLAPAFARLSRAAGDQGPSAVAEPRAAGQDQSAVAESQAAGNQGRLAVAEPRAGEARPLPAKVEPAEGQGPSAHGTVFIGLVKPQFESRHEETDRGVVRDAAVRARTVEEVCAALEANGFAVTGVVESPITGPEGNVEYLVRAVFEGAPRESGRNGAR